MCPRASAPPSRHPMLTALMIWAFAHLLANGDLASLLLFGSFLAFAVVDRISVMARASPGPLGDAKGGALHDIAVIGGPCALRAHAVLGTRQADRRAAAAVSEGRLIAIARRRSAGRPCRRSPRADLGRGRPGGRLQGSQVSAPPDHGAGARGLGGGAGRARRSGPALDGAPRQSSGRRRGAAASQGRQSCASARCGSR